MPFFTLITITLCFWAVALCIGYVTARMVRRLVSWKFVGRCLLAAGIILILRVGVVDDPFTEAVIPVLGVLALAVMGVFLLIIISFMVYHGVKHGDPFIEDAVDPVNVTYTTVTAKKVKAWCPICKANSGCRLRRNPFTGTFVHVIR